MLKRAASLSRLRNMCFVGVLAGTTVFVFGAGAYLHDHVIRIRTAASMATVAEIGSQLDAAVAQPSPIHAIRALTESFASRTDVSLMVMADGPFQQIVASTRAGLAGRSLVGASVDTLEDDVRRAAAGRAQVVRTSQRLTDDWLGVVVPLVARDDTVPFVAYVRVDGGAAAATASAEALRLITIVLVLWVALSVGIVRWVNNRIQATLLEAIDDLRVSDASSREAHRVAAAALAELSDYQAGLDQHALVTVTDLAGTITHVNELFCRISQHSRMELIGATHSLVSSAEHPRTFWSTVWRTVLSGRVWHGQVCNRAKDGSLLWLETTIVPIRDVATGKVARFVALRTDVTQRHRQQQELIVAKELAEAATQAKSSFLTNMSHEIRTPMTAILGYAELLLDTPAGRDPQQREYIDTVHRNGHHLLSIINDILDLAKIEAGKMTLEKLPTDPVQVIEDVASLMRVRAHARKLALKVEYPPQLPACVDTDPTRLKQVLVNLVGNAIKFTAAGSVTIRVDLERTDSGDAQLRFDVIDTGIGMSQEQSSGLFQAFQQADPSTTRRFGGTGLGLHISQRLVTMLGGDLTATSSPGSGSCFTARVGVGPMANLTLRKAGQIVRDTLTQEPVATASGAQPLSGMRVLLAEDGEDNQRLISHHLRKAGADVTVAENGRVAYERLSVDGTLDGALRDPPQFDLVLTDMQMPELDGYGLARLLRTRGWTRPIVALTAHAMAGDAEKCIAAGCDRYAAKPVDRVRLVEACTPCTPRTPRTPVAASPVAAEADSQGRIGLPEFEDEDMRNLALEFARILPQRGAALAAAVERSDMSTVRQCAHKLKGAAAGYGFPLISERAATLELAATRDDYVETARLVAEIVDLCAQVAALVDVSPGGAAVATHDRATRSRVLLIDDSHDLARLVMHHLRDLDVELAYATDGLQGLEMAASSAPDLMLLDFDLPGLDGLSVMRRLRSNPDTARIPVIFLTGNVTDEIQAEAFHEGANDFVRKPFQPAELKARVKAALHTQSLLAELERQATHDTLTGLPNRALLYANMRKAIECKQADPDFHYAVLFLDFNDFKKLNDAHGHDAGDELLRQFATRLQRFTRQSDPKSRASSSHGVAARLGGDEFVLLLTGLAQPNAAEAVATRLQTVLADPYPIAGRDIRSSASIGIAHGARGFENAEAVVNAADAAMYAAKAAGGTRWVVYEPQRASTYSPGASRTGS